MLKEIQIKNFLSYENEKISFPENATIAVVGENGHGKSSMLEAIPFALFGEGRSNLSGMIRNGSDGGMKVSITLTDIPSPGREMRVERGVKPSGGGYTKVWVDSDLLAKGGASPGNNKAQDFIDLALGTDRDTFFLTSFFGLGHNDNLMLVRPAERLETMQKLAGIEVCQKFTKKADEYMKIHVQHVDTAKTEMKVIMDMIVPSKAVKRDLEKARDELTKMKERLEDLYAERNSLLKDEDRYRKLISEKDRLSDSVSRLEASVEGKQNKISKLKIELDGLKEDNREEIKARDKRVRELEKLKSQDDLNDLQETCLSEEAVLIHSIKVKETAIGQSFEGLTECPLCGNEVDSSIQSTWEDEIDDMKKELNEVRIKLDNISESIKLRKNLEKTIEKSKADIRQIASEADSIRKSGSSLTKELEVEKSEMIKAQNKFLSIESEVSGFQDVMDKIQEMDEVLEENHTKVGAQEQTVIHLREQYKKSVDHEREVKKLKDVIETNEEKIKSYKLVKDGFSRYAIPVQLLRNLRNAIEKRATRVFKEFGNGQIKIIDTDGSKSGIEFVLEDENGQRNYKVLSAGEKVMVFVAIRVALTDIVSKARDHKVNFLILDEVAGSLSPNKRESLTRLINKLLRTYFPQVFMVSHVELRDIFNKTLFVEKKNGVSHVQN